jgi:hypothetical protein
LIPECVDHRIQKRSDNCIKYGQKLIQMCGGGRPCIEEYQRTKEQDYYSDMSRKCGQSLGGTSWRVFQNSEYGDNIGNDQYEEGAHRGESTVDCDHEF